MQSTEELNISEIGEDLVSFSREQEVSGRGSVSSLFPYIYIAAKRMSSRAIRNFLLEKHGVKLSAVTIAKALREPEKHLESLRERIEPAARIAARALEVGAIALLKDPKFFDAMRREQPSIWGETNEDIHDALLEFDNAIHTIAYDWFSLPGDLRAMTVALMETDEVGTVSVEGTADAS